MEALPELLGGEWGKGGLVVLVEQGVASLAGVVRQVKKTAESVLLPIAEKVAVEVQVKAKIAQTAKNRKNPELLRLFNIGNANTDRTRTLKAAEIKLKPRVISGLVSAI